MIKTLLLASAISLAPINEVPPQTDAPQTEVAPNEQVDTFEKKTYVYISEDQKEKIEVTLTNQFQCDVVINGEKKQGLYHYEDDNKRIYVEIIGNHYEFIINEDNTLKLKNGFDWTAWLEEFFSPEQISTLISILTNLVMLGFLAFKVIRLLRDKNTTAEQVKKEIMVDMDKFINEAVDEHTKKSLVEIRNALEKQNNVLELFIKIISLQTENTPESRLAIVEAIKQLGMLDEEAINKAKNEINKQVEEEVKHKEEVSNKVENVIKATETAPAVDEDMHGRSI